MFDMIMKNAPKYRRKTPSFLRFPLPREVGSFFHEHGDLILDLMCASLHEAEKEARDRSEVLKRHALFLKEQNEKSGRDPKTKGQVLTAFSVIERRADLFWCEGSTVYFNDSVRDSLYVRKKFDMDALSLGTSFRPMWELPLRAVCLDDVHIELLKNTRAGLPALKKGDWINEEGTVFSPKDFDNTFTSSFVC